MLKWMQTSEGSLGRLRCFAARRRRCCCCHCFWILNTHSTAGNSLCKLDDLGCFVPCWCRCCRRRCCSLRLLLLLLMLLLFLLRLLVVNVLVLLSVDIGRLLRNVPLGECGGRGRVMVDVWVRVGHLYSNQALFARRPLQTSPPLYVSLLARIESRTNVTATRARRKGPLALLLRSPDWENNGRNTPSR